MTKMTEYLFSLIDDESWYDEADPAEWERQMRLHADFAAAVEAAGCRITGGAALERQSTATTVHRSEGREPTLSDGPFAETKEALGGFYLIEAPDLDTALALARTCPSCHVEVRPAMDLSAYE